MRAQQIMAQPIFTCYLEDDLNRAAQLMWENDCGVVPVLDGDGHAVGMLTDRDICMAAYTQGKPLREIPVTSVMSKQLYACRPDDTLDQVQAIMREHKIRRLPVLDREDRPIGIVSFSDLLHAALTEHTVAPGEADGVSTSAAAWTLATICATPRGGGPKSA
jgi:CBS domain-containing protein